jgi:O-acetyl-ADP-ribose deacetylase (regulator of RNase III)
MGGGVSNAIRVVASDNIYKDTKKHIPASLGDVIVTSAVDLPHKYVFHAITVSKENRLVKWVNRPDDPKEVQRFIVRNAVEKCCALLVSLGLNSISFPAIGAGFARIPYDLVAREMAESLTAYLTAIEEQLSIELYLMDRNGKMTEMDFIVFFEQIAIAIQGMKQRFQDQTRPIEDTLAYNVKNKEEATLIRCFMAGSISLEQERNAFRAIVSKADNKWETYNIKSYDYQDFSRSYQKVSHQTTYNEFIVDCTDLMIFVITGKIGSKTREELEVAAKSYDSSGPPKYLYTFKRMRLKMAFGMMA